MKTTLRMDIVRRISIILLYALPGFTLASIPMARRMNLEHHALQLHPNLVAYSLISVIVFFLLERIRLKTHPESLNQPGTFTAALPLLLNLTPFLTLSWFWTAEDLIARIKWAFALSVISYFIWAWHAHLRTYLTEVGRYFRPPNHLLILYLAYFILGSGFFLRGIGFTGDEPHYLIITQSIWEDHDIDVANNYLTGQYGLISKYPLDIHAWQGKGPGIHLYSIHMPGLSFVLAPIYALASTYPPIFYQLIRLGMILIGLWSIHGFYLLVKSISPADEDAVLATLVFSLTVPVIFYVYHLYPEIIILGITTRAFRIWSFPQEKGLTSIFLSGLLVGSTCLFGTKYLGIIAVWFLLTCYRMFKERSIQKPMILFSVSLIPGVMAYLVYLYSCYGHLNPLAVYAGGAKKEEAVANLLYLLTDLSLWNDRLSTFFSYFIDQRDGVFFYSPIYFFGLLGWVHWYRHERRRSVYALFIFLAHTGLYSFFTHRGGFAPPARPMLPVIWVLALGWPYWWKARHRPWVRTIASISILFSLLIPWYMATLPHSIYQSTNHDVTTRASLTYERLSNLLVYLPDLLPSYVKSFSGPWWPNYIWGFFFAFTSILYIGRLIRHRSELIPGKLPREISPGVITFLTAMFFVFMTSSLPKESPRKRESVRFTALDTRVAFQNTRCKINKIEPHYVRFMCSRRKEISFIIDAPRAMSLKASMRCQTPERKLDYWLYWFDFRVKPVEIKTKSKWYSAYHWPYWPEYFGRRWGFVRLLPESPTVIQCRDVELTLYLEFPRT